MAIFNENKNQTAKIANFYMVDESIIKNQFQTLTNKYHKITKKSIRRWSTVTTKYSNILKYLGLLQILSLRSISI